MNRKQQRDHNTRMRGLFAKVASLCLTDTQLRDGKKIVQRELNTRLHCRRLLRDEARVVDARLA